MQITFTENDDLDAVDRVLQALRGGKQTVQVGPHTYRESSDSEISDSMRQAAEGVECRTVEIRGVDKHLFSGEQVAEAIRQAAPEIPARNRNEKIYVYHDELAVEVPEGTDKDDQDIAKVFEAVAPPKPPSPTAPPVTGTPTTSEPVGAPKPHAPTATGSGSSAPCLASHATAGAELDANGMPWDGRIHASTKTKVKAGTWKPKRGVDPELVKQVEAELGTAPSADVTPPPAPPAVGTEQTSTTAAAVAPPVSAPPAPKPPSADASLFQKLVKHLIDHKLADSPQFKEAAAAVGVAGFPELGHPDNLDKLQSVCAALGVI